MQTREVLLVAQRFQVERVTQRSADGVERTREVVRHPGAVVILPLLDDGRVVLLRNYRIAVGQTLVELPAGTRDAGEEPLETARRELAEETGFRASKLELLLTFYMSPGILDEQMWLFAATGLTPGEMNLDAGEQLEPFAVPWSEAIAMIDRGEIIDCKTIAALLYYDRQTRLRQGLRPLP
jgi:ADP-ribose pyrophosphatase